jgi:hypothetical protein
MSTFDENIIDGLNATISIGKDLSCPIIPAAYKVASDLFGLRNEDVTKFKTNGEHLLKLRFRSDSVFYKNFLKYDNSNDNSNIQAQVGVLESALYVLNRGLVEDVIFQNDKMVFTDILAEAKECYKNQKFLLVGVLGRIIIESIVREYAKLKLSQEDYEECTKNKNTNSHKFETTLQTLEQKGKILSNFAVIIRANYKIGTLAAHNDDIFTRDYATNKEMKKYLTFIENEILTLK